VVSSGEEGLALLEKKHFDCMVLDLTLPGMTGLQVLEKMRANPGLANVPVVVYTGRDLSSQEQAQLARLSEAVVLKGTCSPERLLDETALFLHRVHARLPDAQRHLLDRIRTSDPLLADKRVLLVDDDMRNVFTLTTLLERHRMIVHHAESGPAALEWLQASHPVDIVLMDVMMPDMDGYETTRRIRANAKFKKLPIIALTAKAMKGDRDRCLEAGASDYVPKPVEIEQLLSLLRVWLYK
jgi:CheY-like chemotaxis protein